MQKLAMAMSVALSAAIGYLSLPQHGWNHCKRAVLTGREQNEQNAQKALFAINGHKLVARSSGLLM